MVARRARAESVIVRLSLGAVLLAAVVALFAHKIAAKMPDFEVYWRAGSRAAAAEPLYREEDEHFRLKYLPAFAVLAIPAALLPLPAAKAIWFGITVSLIPVLLALSLGLLPARSEERRVGKECRSRWSALHG